MKQDLISLFVEQQDFRFQTPLPEPAWSHKVPRWYQLDGPALALTDLFSQKPRNMDFLILASPLASNLTDWEFVQSGKKHAQKFVHTLPNIRASMALQVADHVCEFLCLQKGPETRSMAFAEFMESIQYKNQPALAIVDQLEESASSPHLTYRTTLISLSSQGNWHCRRHEQPSQNDFEEKWNKNLIVKEQSFRMGSWNWERIN